MIDLQKPATSSLIKGYADSYWANDFKDRKSTSGHFFKVYGI